MVLPNLDRFASLPRFRDGRIDYTGSSEAAGVYVVVRYHNELLVLKRSSSVSSMVGEWFFCCGFLDDPNKTIEEQALEELAEETTIRAEHVSSTEYLGELVVKEKGGAWYVHVVAVALQMRPSINLNWEHDEYSWMSVDNAARLFVREGAKKALLLFKEKNKS